MHKPAQRYAFRRDGRSYNDSSPKQEALSHGDLLQLLRYEPDAGEFLWLVDRRRVKAGARAGGIQLSGYWVVSINGRRYAAHRLAWFYVHGEWPPALIDHVDGDKENNRIANLRLASSTQNRWNSRLRSDNASGHKGVYWSEPRRAWIAYITKAGKTSVEGAFATLEEAREARARAEERVQGEYRYKGEV